MKSGRLFNYSVLTVLMATLAGCGAAPQEDAPTTSSVAAIPEAEPDTSSTDAGTIAEGDDVAVEEKTTITTARSKTIPSADPKPNDLARRQRLAEAEAKRLAYHQRWEAEQQRNQQEQQVRVQQQRNQQQRLQAQARLTPVQRPVRVPPVAVAQRKVSYVLPAPRMMPAAPRMLMPAMPAPSAGGYGGQGNGNYYAESLTGSFAGQPIVASIIEKLVHDGFDRGYLYGVFSQAQYKPDVAAIWAKYYAKGGEQPKGNGGGGYPSYRGKFLTAGNIGKGRAFWARYAPHLMRAQQQYGVSAEYIVGIMGVETRWGEIMGKHRILDALITSAVAVPHRASFFTSEIENFMMMTRSERMDPLQPKGSYAGAMGYGQFMPSSFRSYAVDFDGDGIRDLWNPVDAIGSIANYFAKHGWRPGEDVVIPASVSSNNYYSMPDGYKVKYSMSSLAKSGIQPAQAYRASGSAHLLALSHDGGKAPFIGFNNFYVITRYNHSNYYAMTVHELGQAVKQGVGAIYAQR